WLKAPNRQSVALSLEVIRASSWASLLQSRLAALKSLVWFILLPLEAAITSDANKDGVMGTENCPRLWLVKAGNSGDK
ncbi:MAG TPA: hypothetical protein VI138_06670, partial [Candidatus Dormibacteraeota bacterium]